jgi:catechol 2,3-dioxygenase-like lactoylglutathione lyase family enzyme
LKISHLDHLVLTVRDVAATCVFYSQVLGMEPITFAGGRRALVFGNQKLNLHSADEPLQPHARQPTPGSADLCFITTTPLEDVLAHLERLGIALCEGPVQRSGACGPITSVYFRDPDGNLLEVSRYHS